jgi:hypothetical protein
MVWWIGGPLIRLLQPLGTSLRTKRRWVTTPLQTPGGCLPACKAPVPFVAKIRRVSDINGQIADPKFVLRRRDLHAPGGHSYLPPLKLIGIPAFFSTGEISTKSEIQNSKLKNGDFFGISIFINRKNKEKNQISILGSSRVAHNIGGCFF